jgi:site-specific recombinase XerD
MPTKRETPSASKRATSSTGNKEEKSRRQQPTPHPTRNRATPIRSVLRIWLDDGRSRWSAKTLAERERVIERLCWWMEEIEGVSPTLDHLDRMCCRAYTAYAREANFRGRWHSRNDAARNEARPSTVASYFNILRSFLNFCTEEGLLPESPVKGIAQPHVPDDQVQPFSPTQVQKILDAARRSSSPERNTLLVLLLVDTGLRVSELCSLNVGDADRESAAITVIGKGSKQRQTYLGASTRRALWRYVEMQRRHAAPNDPLFLAERGHRPGERLTSGGVGQLVTRLGEMAGITGVRCSPHTFRHTFAITFLRSGGNVLELKAILGHEDLKMVNRYVALASVDLAVAHRKASPVQALKLR